MAAPMRGTLGMTAALHRMVALVMGVVPLGVTEGAAARTPEPETALARREAAAAPEPAGRSRRSPGWRSRRDSGVAGAPSAQPRPWGRPRAGRLRHSGR